MAGAQLMTRVLANFAVIAILGHFAPGFEVASLSALVLAALVLGVIASLLVWLVFSLVSLWLGVLLLLPINLGAFYLTAALVPGFAIHGVGWALLGTVLLGAINALLGEVFGGWLQPPRRFGDDELRAIGEAMAGMRQSGTTHDAEADEPGTEPSAPEPPAADSGAAGADTAAPPDDADDADDDAQS